MPVPAFRSLAVIPLALPVLAAGCGGDTRAESTPRGPSATAPLTEAPDRFVHHGPIRIRYREIGRGDPVVLLHGYTDRLEMWAGMADSIAVSHRVIVPDVRGFGASSRPGEAGSYGRAMAGDVVALLDSLGIDRAHLVGYSMGALITSNVAVRSPERVRSAVLVAGPFYADSAALARAVAPYLTALERGEGLLPFFRFILPTWADSLLVPAAEHYLAENELTALIGSLREMGGLVPGATDLATLAIPATAVVGRNDPMLPYSRLLATRWPGLRLVELDDADHAVVFGVPAVLHEFRRLAAGH